LAARSYFGKNLVPVTGGRGRVGEVR